MDGSVNSQRFYPTRSVCFKDLYWYAELAVFSLAVEKVICQYSMHGAPTYGEMATGQAQLTWVTGYIPRRCAVHHAA